MEQLVSHEKDLINLPNLFAIPMHPLVSFLSKYPHAAKPQKATIRELDIKIDQKQILCYFSRANFDVDVPLVGGINAVVADIISGRINVSGQAYKGSDWKNGTNPMQDKQVTPLSLRCSDLRYIIYLLSDKNWEFSLPKDGLGPFSVSTEGMDYNFDDGASGSKRVAYLISDGAQAWSGKPSYSHRINLHVDLVYGPARIPIIIDPDIRHPGGSGEQ